MLAHFARRSVVAIEPYGWEATSATIAARLQLPADTILRFDLNTVPSAPPSWYAAMTAARDGGGPQEYADPTYDELTTLLGDYCDVAPDQILVGAGADEILRSSARLSSKSAMRSSSPPRPTQSTPCARSNSARRCASAPSDRASHRTRRGCSPPPGGETADPLHPEQPDQQRLRSGDRGADHRREPLPDRAGRSLRRIRRLVGVAPPRPLSAPDRRPHDVQGVRAGRDAPRLRSRQRGGDRAPPTPPPDEQHQRRDGADRRRRATRPPGDARERRPDRGGAHIALGGRAVYPSITNFLLTDWGGQEAAQAVATRLERRGIIVRNYARHALLLGHLRITVRSDEQHARFLAALRD